jgi:hypothetical protein
LVEILLWFASGTAKLKAPDSYESMRNGRDFPGRLASRFPGAAIAPLTIQPIGGNLSLEQFGHHPPEDGKIHIP